MTCDSLQSRRGPVSDAGRPGGKRLRGSAGASSGVEASSPRRRGTDVGASFAAAAGQTVAASRLAWDAFCDAVRHEGGRRTQARRIVFEHVLGRSDHFRAEAVVEALGRRGAQRVSRATVYNTLRLLVRLGVLRELRAREAGSRFEVVKNATVHAHLVCEVCGVLLEAESDELRRGLEALCSSLAFEMSAPSVIVYGTCATCRRRP